jgi:hypothetical protein
VGIIARALPNARIACLRRHPMDTVLSNFRNLFAITSRYYDYSYDLMDIARYYARFDRLMAFWQQALPGLVLELSYEDLVADQEGQTRRLLDHCGLAWNAACLDFTATPRRSPRPAPRKCAARSIAMRSRGGSGMKRSWRRWRPTAAAEGIGGFLGDAPSRRGAVKARHQIGVALTSGKMAITVNSPSPSGLAFTLVAPWSRNICSTAATSTAWTFCKIRIAMAVSLMVPRAADPSGVVSAARSWARSTAERAWSAAKTNCGSSCGLWMSLDCMAN